MNSDGVKIIRILLHTGNDIMIYGVYLTLFLFTSTTTIASLVNIRKKILSGG